ncbi:hypothetical protein SLE2022_175080 [Rubroshorea leprosula]
MVKERVCVTGAGGYLGSWVVKLLLSRDYAIHGTLMRFAGDEKYAHLNKLDKASENLKLLKAELLAYESLYSAIEGCSGVFHVASPLPLTAGANPEVELVEPAVKGTLNVLKACVEAKVKRVVVVSSVVAVALNPGWPKAQIKDESCWYDKEYCRTTKNCMQLIKLLKDGIHLLGNKTTMIVDMRDVAKALILVYEKPEAVGIYICIAYSIKEHDLVDKLRTLYPNYNYPKSFTEAEDEILSSEKLQRLGWRYRLLEETLVDAIESYKKAGFLD